MAIADLHILVRRCIHDRINAVDCQDVVQFYRSQHPFSSLDLVVAILNASLNFCTEGDPIISQYVRIFLVSGLIKTSDLLTASIKLWDAGSKSDGDAMPKLVSVLTAVVSSLTINTLAERETQRCIRLLTKWLGMLATFSTTAVKGHDAASLTEAVGFVLATMITPSTLTAKTTYSGIQKVTDQCMSLFPNISMQLMNKMTAVPKPDSYQDEAASPNTLNIAAFQFEANIHDTQVVSTRASTTAYLRNMMLLGSTIDDSVLFSFLSTRYQGNHTIMFSEAVMASFDTIGKSTPSNEIYHQQCRLFILNKLPHVLASISTSPFASFSSEVLLIDCWSYLNTSDNPDATYIGPRFLQICSFHHLIPIETVTSTLAVDLLPGLKGLYAKEDLVNQVAASHARGPRLIDELLKNDGNAGSIAQAISEIMQTYCINKDTQHLKDITSMIVRKPAAISAIALFIRPAIFLAPICNLLDDWKWDEIHGESQPVYEEFGCIFLLLLATKQRLQLDGSEVGLQQKNGFIAQFLASANSERELSSLSELYQKHLGDWIQSLYIDEGLSDELTTKCSPHDFYLLLPTLMRQSVLARSKGKLTAESFRAGLEYLLEPFLLPSLMSVFGWVTRIAAKEPKIAAEVIQIFIKQPTDPETQELHHTVTSIAISQMSRLGLTKTPELGAVIKSIKYDEFIVKSADVLLGNVCESLAQLSNHIAEAASGTTDFSHEMLEMAIYSWGPNQVVQVFVTLLIQLSGGTDFHPIVDFAATITTMNSSLRNSLQVFRANLASYLKQGNNLFAEAVVHLSRRVELYHHALSVQNIEMDQSFVPMASMNMASIDLDAGPAVPFEQTDHTQTEDIDQVLNDAAAMEGLESVNASNFDDTYGFQAADLGIDDFDLDLDMFS